MSGLRVALFPGGSSLISRAIRWQTRGRYSHAAILFSDGVLIESREGQGVRRLWPYAAAIYLGAERADLFRLVLPDPPPAAPTPHPVNEPAARAFAEAQLGKSYDLGSVLRFVTRTQESRNGSGKWFCSELAFAILTKAGAPPLARIEPWAVSPEHLSHSPLLEFIATATVVETNLA